MEINIFNGPKKEFEKEIPKEKITLPALIFKYDENHRKLLIKGIGNNSKEKNKEEFNCLVAYSENYSGINESAIQSFNNIIDEYTIKKIYLQNPPKTITKIIENNYKNIEYKDYNYLNFNKENFIKINDEFDKRIIGQEKAKIKILNALYPLIKGYNHEKPITLLFYGESGIGKTETAKFISDILGEKLFRKQFSMFQNNKFSEYLFGGSHTHASFAKDLLERESNVILLDEFDKAANVFYEAFYQLFDEGIFEDNNYKVKLKNSIIICTCNYNNLNEIRKNIGDPLYYRFNSIIKFENLNDESIMKIIELNINKKYEKLDSYDKELINKEEIEILFKKNYKKLKNSRQIYNLIEEKINSILTKKFIENEKNKQ